MVKEIGKKLIAQNKKARHDYSIEDVYECGLVLTGTEVKSLRAGRASLIDGFAMIVDAGVHRTNQTDIVSDGTKMSHQFTEIHPALTVLAKSPRATEQLAAGFTRVVILDVAGVGLHVQPVEFRLGIEEIHLRGRA